MKTEIEQAVSWWTSSLIKPEHNNGDGIQSTLMSMVASSKEITAHQLATFADKLTSLLTDRHQQEGVGTVLSVDYHPDRLLREAGEAAHISDFSFPCKTVMRLERGCVSVKCGYGAPVEIIYEEENTK